MSLFSLQDILRKLAQKNPHLGRRIEEVQSLQFWDRAVGDLIAKHARALKVESGVLTVEVDHSVWKAELHHRKAQIISKMNESLSESQKIKDLFLVDSRGSRSSSR